MSVRITHVRLSSPDGDHSHITDYKWINDSDRSVGESSKSTMVAWIDGGGRAYVGTGSSRVEVGVVRPQYSAPYLRTHSDGSWTNNLLSLPRF